MELRVAPATDPDNATTLIPDGTSIRDLAADDDYIYYWEFDSRNVFRIGWDGGEPEVFLTDYIPNGMMVYEGYLYFFDDYLWRMPVSGGEPENLADGHFEALFTAEGDTIYWTDQNNNSVNAYTLGEPRRKQLASFAGSAPRQPRVQGGQVYFTRNSTNCSVLYTTNKDTNEALEHEYVTQGFDSASVWRVEESSVVLLADDGVYRVAR
jgi:hypothetical protein